MQFDFKFYANFLFRQSNKRHFGTTLKHDLIFCFIAIFSLEIQFFFFAHLLCDSFLLSNIEMTNICFGKAQIYDAQETNETVSIFAHYGDVFYAKMTVVEQYLFNVLRFSAKSFSIRDIRMNK